jgi:hypothetical protein
VLGQGGTHAAQRPTTGTGHARTLRTPMLLLQVLQRAGRCVPRRCGRELRHFAAYHLGRHGPENPLCVRAGAGGGGGVTVVRVQVEVAEDVVG